MDKYIPLFPLNLVVYPEEKLNLHIFEPRYKQLIGDIKASGGTFGIPPFINNKISEYGAEMKLLSIEKVYSDGRMDIKTKGAGIFRINRLDNPAVNKLYLGGSVTPTEQEDDEDPKLRKRLLKNLDYLYALLNATFDVDGNAVQPLSFMIAHNIGLSLEQEYKLLKLNSEKQRQEFLNKHLKKTIPVIAEMERTKARISMNGHFKHLDPLNF
jgi:Lon protease-like protein